MNLFAGLLAAVFGGLVIYSLATGRTIAKHSRTWIERDEQPLNYWGVVVSYTIAAGLFLAVALRYHGQG